MKNTKIDWLGITKLALHVIGKPVASNAEICDEAGVIARKRGVHLTKTWRTTVNTTMRKYDDFHRCDRGYWGLS